MFGVVISIIIAISIIGYFFILPLFIDKLVEQVTTYDRITHQQVFDSEEMRTTYYDIHDNKNPGDYGYNNWREVNYNSLYDAHIKLSAWWVQSASEDNGGIKAPVIMLSHGRTANRLKPMKLLAMFKQLGLDTHYNFFIPDHRNSGKSSKAVTAMGNKFAEDIAAATFYCQDNFASNQFTYYSFSMGAMATAVFLHRNDLQREWKSRGIVVEKIVLDSPLSNIDATLRGVDLPLPAFILDAGLNKFAKQITTSDGTPYYHEMHLGNLLQNVDVPVLILNNKGDQTTRQSVLEPELQLLEDKPNIQTEFFEPGDDEPLSQRHVQMYTNHKQQYIKVIEKFFQ